MNRKFGVLGCATLMTLGSFGGFAFAQPRAVGQAMQDAVEKICIVEITSPSSGRIELQNLCFNPKAVRISWEDGRLFDYCLNSSGDVRYVQKLTDGYKLTREQDILLCQ